MSNTKQVECVHSSRLEKIETDLQAIRELLEAWNQAKAVIVMIRALARFARVMLPIITLLAGLWVLVKTGKWEISQ